MSPHKTSLGFADLHVHQFANLAFGGNVIWGTPFGLVPSSLAPCSRIHGRHGRADWIGNLSRTIYTGGSWRSLLGHDIRGAPDFSGWPAWNDFTHQLAHEQLLKRAVDGGLRLMVVVAFHNELLCRLYHMLRLTSDDMEAVDLQLQAAKDMEAHIDDACGGPGTGWYRIVRSPSEAREVIDSERLAVVLGVEVDNVFGSYFRGGMTPKGLTNSIEKYYQAGVRHVIPIHFRDNAFGGAAFALPLHWSSNNGIISKANPARSLPVYLMNTRRASSAGYDYRDGHCNARGLTVSGRQLISELMNHGMIIDVDHMSATTRSGVLDLAESAHYPVVAGHAEFREISRVGLRSERLLSLSEIHRIHDGGGAVAPLVRQSTVAEPEVDRATTSSFIRAYRYLLEASDASWVGFGSDINGFAALPRPEPVGASRLEYPFAAPIGGGLMDRSVLGNRVFDIGRDGVAHIGMLPDFLAQLGTAGLAGELQPVMRSAIGYVELWERARSGTHVP
jgi:microsomal dipeptidase-like Zn-dependent dipeptidase